MYFMVFFIFLLVAIGGALGVIVGRYDGVLMAGDQGGDHDHGKYV
jgi:hypothetical protein